MCLFRCARPQDASLVPATPSASNAAIVTDAVTMPSDVPQTVTYTATDVDGLVVTATRTIYVVGDEISGEHV